MRLSTGGPEVLDNSEESATSVLAEPVEEGLLERLRLEFGERVVGFLDTARGLLNSGFNVPRLGETVAYCLREALQAVLDSGWARSGEWRNLSDGSLRTDGRHDIGENRPGGGTVDGGGQLSLAADGAGGRPGEGVSRAGRQLIAVVIGFTGGAPLPGQVERFTELRDEANDGLHGDLSLSEACELWSRCLRLLEQFFMAPERRRAEIERLARIESPSGGDRDSVVGLLRGSDHVRLFFANVTSPVWIAVLDGSELIGPFEDMEMSGWPALSAVKRLSPEYPEDTGNWLASMYDRYIVGGNGEGPLRARSLTLAALHADPPALGVVLRALRDYPTDRNIVLRGVRAVRKIPPADSLVADFADMLLGDSCWKAWPHSESVVERLVEGINASNALGRIELLCYKIQASDNTTTTISLEQSRGSVVDIANDPPYRDRLFVLVRGLIDAISKGRNRLTTAEVLAVLENKRFPRGLAGRFRAWILAGSSDTDHDLLIGEIEQAIGSQAPTGDHLLLIDRVVEECDPASYVSRWRDALGAGPDVDKVERAVAADQLLPGSWIRAWRWAAVLPGEVSVGWSALRDALATRYGQPDREEYEYRRPRAERVTSPITVEELQMHRADEAARRIAAWRARSDEWRLTHAGARELGRSLETLVKDNPGEWTSDPVRIATALRHSTYINHYLRALGAVATSQMPINELVDLIGLVRTHPWEVEVLGEGKFAYDSDWSGAEEAAVELIESLARNDADFGDRTQEVWDFLQIRSGNCPEGEETASDSQLDAYRTAINGSCTRALDAVIHLIANEYRRSGTAITSRAVHILEASLRLSGDNGLQHRAILARHVGFLRHVLPEWTENNLDLFFGDRAPDGLGQHTFNMVIKWGQPHWLLAGYRPMLKQAVRDGVARSLDFLLVGMLNRTDGYSPQENLNFLRQTKEAVSDAGASLAWLLQQEDANPQHLQIAQAFWEAALQEGNMPLDGFGRFAYVTAMNPERWAELTLGTLEANNDRIHHNTQVAEGIVTMTPTPTTLTILRLLIQGRFDQDLRTEIAEHAQEHLRSATALATTHQYQRLRNLLQERDITNN